MAFDKHGKHLFNLTLADPESGVPDSKDILLGADMLSRMVLHGQWFGPSESPSAIKTTFGWLLAGSVRTVGTQKSTRQLLFHYRIS